jgi:hypothetical protein
MMSGPRLVLGCELNRTILLEKLKAQDDRKKNGFIEKKIVHSLNIHQKKANAHRQADCEKKLKRQMTTDHASE